MRHEVYHNMIKRDNKILIKRYQNRKLYDTQNSCYVTLDDIATMTKDGEEIRVIDNKSKEDLTAVTLAQIIFEEEKKKKSLLPLSALRKIIQDGGESIKDFFEHALDSGVQSISSAREEAGKVIHKIKGQINPEETSHLLQEVLHRTQGFSKKIDEKIKSTVGSVTHISQFQDEVQALRQRILQLEKRLKKYE